MSDDDMYWPDKYPWRRQPAPRTPARAPVMFEVILTLLWVVVRRGQAHVSTLFKFFPGRSAAGGDAAAYYGPARQSLIDYASQAGPEGG